MKRILSKLLIAGLVICQACNKTDSPDVQPFGTDDRAITGLDFYNGQVLLPDYAHKDTLVVTNAVELSCLLNSPVIATDGEIAWLLSVTTRKY